MDDISKLKDKERIYKLIKTSLELFGPNQQLGDNYITGEFNLTKFEWKALLLGKLLDKAENYNLKSKLNKLLYSHGLKDNNYYNPFLDIFKEIHKEQITDSNLLDGFIKRLDEYLDSITKEPLIEYTLLFPINLIFQNEIPAFLLQNHKDIRIHLVRDINKYYNTIWEFANEKYPESIYAEGNKKVRELINQCNRYNFFIVRGQARNINYLVNKAVYDIEANIGLFAFILHKGRGITHLNVEPFPSEKSTTNIRMPLVFIIEKEKCKTIYFSNYEKLINPIDIREIEDMSKLISIIQEIKFEKLRLLLIDAFASYFDALKTPSYSISFLKFWNIIERLLLKEGGITLTEITRRLLSLYPETATKDDMKDLINILYQKRNLFVHESKDTITSDDKSYMKSMVEHVIITLLNLRFEFNDIGMMHFFYQNLRKSSNVIKNEFKILELLEKIKSSENENKE